MKKDGSQNLIHPTAIIDPKARVGAKLDIGPWSIIEENTELGDDIKIDSHALIASGTRVGNGCKISKGAVVGTAPQDLKYHDEDSTLEVGERTVIREFCTLNRGTEHGGMVTRVGNDCLLMAYVHVAHDCQIGNNVILANAVNMAGHVEIQDHASIGGVCVIHQFARIGTYAFIGGMSRVSQDVPPYILTTSEPMKYYGANSIGLRRKGFTNEQIRNIKKAYSFIYRKNLNLKQAVRAIRDEMEIEDVVKVIVDFVETSERGII